MRSSPRSAAGPGLDEEFLARYLSMLRIPRRPPSRDALGELVAAHVTRVPFETISKLYYRKQLGLTTLIPIELFLQGIQRYHFGGTCYANNYHLYTLLAGLGYDVKLCGADMANPGVHIVLMVTVDGREYLVDAGYGAPFLNPMPRDVDRDYMIEWGHDRYVLEPQDATGCSRLKLYKDGAAKHGYLAKPAPRQIDDFADVIAASFRAQATFMNAVLLVRYYLGRSLTIHNLTVIETRGSGSAERKLASANELIGTIVREFEMPQEIVAEAIGQLGTLRDAWE